MKYLKNEFIFYYFEIEKWNLQIYSFGNGNDGRLGLGKTGNVDKPTIISTLLGVKIESIYGGYNSVIATACNSLFYFFNYFFFCWNEMKIILFE